MSEIYTNSVLNIGLTGAPDSQTCSFETRWVDKPDGTPVDTRETKIIHYNAEYTVYGRITLTISHNTFRASSHLWEDIDSGNNPKLDLAPMWNRGSVFQERYLAHRMIHFHGSEMVWECRSRITCECSGLDNDSHPHDIKKFLTARRAVYPELFLEHLLSVWRSVMFEYSRLKLTRPSDRFPALAGLARHFHQMTGPQPGLSYLAGFFAIEEFDLLRELLWVVRKFSFQSTSTYTRRVRESGAPSWSWASMLVVNGSDFIGSEVFSRTGGRNYNLTKHAKLKIISVSFDSDSEDDPLFAQGWQLSIRGILKLARIDTQWIADKGRDIVPIYDANDLHLPGRKWEPWRRQFDPGFTPDCDLWNAGMDGANPTAYFLCMGQISRRNGDKEDIGLALRCSPHHQGVMERIGICQCEATDNFFEDGQLHTLTII